MKHTQASTPLDAVQVEHRGPLTDVWLRKNIRDDVVDDVYGSDITYWEADEVYGIVMGHATVEGVTPMFDELWDRFEEDAMTDAERIADARDTASTNSDAIAELAEMVADGEVTMEDLSQAIMELAEIVGGGV